MPSERKSFFCCSGAVSQRASSYASFVCSLCFGTVRKEPPWLPVLPGTGVTSHLPLPESPPASLIWLSIHAGQATVANEPCLIATFQACVNVVAAAVCPLAAMPPARENA